MSDLKQEFDQAMAQLTAPGAPYELGGDDDNGHFFLNAPATLPEALAVARNHGDREFLIYEGERRSFNDLMDEADAIAAALHEFTHERKIDVGTSDNVSGKESTWQAPRGFD